MEESVKIPTGELGNAPSPAHPSLCFTPLIFNHSSLSVTLPCPTGLIQGTPGPGSHPITLLPASLGLQPPSQPPAPQAWMLGANQYQRNRLRDWFAAINQHHLHGNCQAANRKRGDVKQSCLKVFSTLYKLLW